eukprot:467290_1
MSYYACTDTPITQTNQNTQYVAITPSSTEFNPPSCIVPPNTKTHTHHNSFGTISASSVCSSSSTSSLSSSCSEYSLSSAQLANDTGLDNKILYKFGYKVLNTISDTTHGTLYHGKMIKISNNIKNINSNSLKLESQKTLIVRGLISNEVTIKKVLKDKINVIIDGKNIVKEAQLLYYLTVQNKPYTDNICSFIEFIETETDYYLIEEYAGSMTLSEFTSIAHDYIKQKRLKIKDWKTVVKYIFWKLMVHMFWMHNDMNVAHLNLNMDNIMVQNVNFMEQKENGYVTINTNKLNVKICDFGYSEVFSFDVDINSRFQCVKSKLTKKYKSPKELAAEIFDARKADSYSLGIILFVMFTGVLPFEVSDIGYVSLKNKQFIEYVEKNNLMRFFSKTAFFVVKGLLNFNEDERMCVYDVLNNDWFKHYYLKYKSNIEKKSKNQKR